MATRLLINEPPLQVLPTLAERIGLNEAIVLQQLFWLISHPRIGIEEDGYKWVDNSWADWKERNFPFWSVRTIRRVFDSLKEKGLVLVRPVEGKQINAYTVDVDAVEALENDEKEGGDQGGDGGQVDHSFTHSPGQADHPFYIVRERETIGDRSPSATNGNGKARASQPNGKQAKLALGSEAEGKPKKNGRAKAEWEQVADEMAQWFEAKTGLKPPQNSFGGYVKLWRKPLYRVVELYGGDTGRAKQALRTTISDFWDRDDPLTIKSPLSLLATIESSAAQQRMSNKTPVTVTEQGGVWL